ncbi:MAG: LysM peptidoglycan-binding domain-containing protein [Balneolaceae bacterium]
MTKQPGLYRLLLATLISGAMLITAPETGSAQAGDVTHTVRQGETLYSIAQQYNLTVTELRQWNSLESDQLSTGATLRIRPPAGDDESLTHTVQAGETLFSISRRYNVSIAEIQQWNQLQTNLLENGQELLIYRSDPSDTAGSELQAEAAGRSSIVGEDSEARASTYYTVRSGDTLTRIANEHDMSLNELRSLNNLQSDMLNIGQRLLVRQGQSTPVVEEDAAESTPQGRFASYRLQSGENTQTILNRFEMSLEELEALNPGLEVENLGNGQQVTVLLPPNRSFRNPYLRQSGMENLGSVPVQRYSPDDIARPTTSGELYHPDQLTAAHANMSLGNIIYIENPGNGRGIYVKVNDRFSGNGLKLSDKAFELLGFSSVERAVTEIYLEEDL